MNIFYKLNDEYQYSIANVVGYGRLTKFYSVNLVELF